MHIGGPPIQQRPDNGSNETARHPFGTCRRSTGVFQNRGPTATNRAVSSIFGGFDPSSSQPLRLSRVWRRTATHRFHPGRRAGPRSILVAQREVVRSRRSLRAPRCSSLGVLELFGVYPRIGAHGIGLKGNVGGTGPAERWLHRVKFEV